MDLKFSTNTNTVKRYLNVDYLNFVIPFVILNLNFCLYILTVEKHSSCGGSPPPFGFIEKTYFPLKSLKAILKKTGYFFAKRSR